MNRVSFKTLGCKLNQAETESIATGFRRRGWKVVDFGEAADVAVVNGCTVTTAADRKSRSAVNRARRSGGPNPDPVGPAPLVVMTGCYVDGHRDEIEADGRTLVVGNAAKSRIPELVEARRKGEILPVVENERDPFGYPVAERIFHTRAMVKIQDGCDNYCTFCIIPFVRGRAVSRPLEDVVQAVREAVAGGYREVVLTGVNMSRWESGNKKFADLIGSCLDIPGDWRLRLGSVEPDRLSDEMIDLFTHPHMTPHLHLCLQSGSEKILLKMRRQYTAREFEAFVTRIRTVIPDFNVTTDVIVGFPGETDEDFAFTTAICRRIGFGHIHTFPYSRREGTRADRMGDHVSDKVKRVRAGEIRRISEETKRTYRNNRIGSLQEVLVERADREPDGTLTARGLGKHYLPVRFSLPALRDPSEVVNRFFTLRVTDIDDGDDPDLTGEVVPRL